MKGWFIKLLIRIFVIELNIYLKWSLFCQKYLMKERLELPKIQSITEIENILGQGIWHEDPWWLMFDAISSPEYSYYNLVNKKGPWDCDDAACLSCALLQQLPRYQDVQMLSVQWLREGKFIGHNVCIFRDTEEEESQQWCWMGNWFDGHVARGYKNIEDIVKHMIGNTELLSYFTFDHELKGIISSKIM